MALQNDTSRIQYNGNNSTTNSYAIPFVFFENAHIKCVVTTSAGVDTELTLGSGFNVTGAGNANGGSLTTTTAVPTSSKVTIFRNVPATQTTSYQEGGDFPAASHERALDKLTMIAQQTKRLADRALKVPETQANPNDLPNSGTGQKLLVSTSGTLGWEENRNPPPYPTTAGTQALVTAGSGAAPSWQTIPAIATGPITATGSTTPRFLGDRFADVVNVKDYGADFTGVADSRSAIEAAIAASPENTTLFFPRGTYKISTGNFYGITISASKNGLNFVGDSAVFLATNRFNPAMFEILSDKVCFSGITFDGFWRNGDSKPANPVPAVESVLTFRGSYGKVINCTFKNIQTNAIVTRDGKFHDSLYIKSGNHNFNNNVFDNVYVSILPLTTNQSPCTATAADDTFTANGHILLDGQEVELNNLGINVSAASSGSPASATFTANSHGLSNGSIVRFYNLVGGTGLVDNTAYWIVNATTNTFQVSLTQNGAAINITTALTSALCRIAFGNIAGLANGVVYFVRDRTANTFKLAAAPSGAAVNVTANITSGNVSSSAGLENYTINNNIFRNNGFVGSSVYPRGISFGAFDGCASMRQFSICNNVFNSAGDLAIEIFGQHKSGQINGNVIECPASSNTSTMGISCGGGDNIALAGNTIRGGSLCQLEIAQSTNLTVSGNVLDCKNTNGQFATNSLRTSINISNQAGLTCDNLSITGNIILNGVTAIFTNATFTRNVTFASNVIEAEATLYDNALNYIFHCSGNRSQWIIANNAINILGSFQRRIVADLGGGEWTLSFHGNTIKGQTKEVAFGFSNSGWLDISGNDFRNFTSQTDDLSNGTIVNTVNVTNVSYKNNVFSDYANLNKWLPETEDDIEQSIQQPPFRHVLQLGSEPVVDNSGAWPNWSGVKNFAEKHWGLSLDPSTAAGWARASVYEFGFSSGSTNVTPAFRPFVFRVFAGIPADRLSTTFIWGSQLNETGGALSARGLRFSTTSSAGSSNVTGTLAIHNGTSETTSTFTIAPSSLYELVFVWQPIVSANTAQSGSKFRLFAAPINGKPVQLAQAVLTTALNATGFAGGAFSVIAHSSVQTPGYNPHWTLANLNYYYL